MLAGPTGIATRVRSWFAPVLNEQPAVAWGTVAFAYLLLLLWGGTHALRVWWGILLLGGLLALGVFALRLQTLQEFPPGTAALPAAAGADPSATDELERLTALHTAGAIDDAEFEAAKKAALT